MRRRGDERERVLFDTETGENECPATVGHGGCDGVGIADRTFGGCLAGGGRCRGRIDRRCRKIFRECSVPQDV
jgi:hypothetical protein